MDILREKMKFFAKNLTEQKNIWFQDVPETKLAEVLCEAQEFALELDRPELYRMYLEENIQDFMKHYWEQTFFAFSGRYRSVFGQAFTSEISSAICCLEEKDTEISA
ncbi:MAG: hypothetical protein ACLTN0_03180 [Coprococcus phoceensis]